MFHGVGEDAAHVIDVGVVLRQHTLLLLHPPHSNPPSDHSGSMLHHRALFNI
jgi:hypothetical protein